METADLNACADLVRRGDPDRFLAAMASPVAARRVLFPIYAFNVEVARAPWVTQEPMIAEMRLQWWRDALQEIQTGENVRRHEVVTPLAGVLDAEGAGLLDQLVAARRWDIYKDAFEDADHFSDYLEKTAGNLMLAAARSLGACDEAAIRDAGYAHGVANWLRAIPALEQAGRIPLPDGRPEAVGQLASEALTRLRRARASRAKVSGDARPALLPLWQSGTILNRAKTLPARVGAGTLDPAPIRSRLTLMVRAATGLW
ncbi:squalene/phytoene synthase family protein [uncultured Roseovarius sp.]|uniref:squalene/phytoene synthase family protein n=1 Tax=uncultured Roseovarius sp. TaxID=293344 RepID=UPI00261D50A2|nr:squalene/phytoene synthase family protein [uncultured Roseovarius sp.]